jgi:hypothetical protein
MTTTSNMTAPWGRTASTDIPGDLARPRRVRLLLDAVVLLSAFDLALTLRTMLTTGMFEANPLVRLLCEHPCPVLAIAGFKACSTIVATALIHRLRRHVQAEVGAWLMVLILAWVSVQWRQYALATCGADAETLAAVASFDPSWVALR